MTTVTDPMIPAQTGQPGEAGWNVTQLRMPPGPYQSAWSAAEEALFITASDFRGAGSELVKLSPDSLKTLARVTPADFPEDQRLPVSGAPEGLKIPPAGVYGVGVDDSRGRVWVTNTPNNTVAIYDSRDLTLIRQHPPETVCHPREVLVDPAVRRAFVSSSVSPNVCVFDSETLEKTGLIEIRSPAGAGDFQVMSLALNPERGALYVTGRGTNELAVIDTGSLEVRQVLPLPGAKDAAGLAVDPRSGQIFVVAQGSGNLLILNGDTGEVAQSVAVGAGALSVVWDPVNGLAWVAARGAGSLSAITPEGRVVARLEGGSCPNHVSTDGRGRIFALNKSLGAEDADADRLRIITRAL